MRSVKKEGKHWRDRGEKRAMGKGKRKKEEGNGEGELKGFYDE